MERQHHNRWSEIGQAVFFLSLSQLISTRTRIWIAVKSTQMKWDKANRNSLLAIKHLCDISMQRKKPDSFSHSPAIRFRTVNALSHHSLSP